MENRINYRRFVIVSCPHLTAEGFFSSNSTIEQHKENEILAGKFYDLESYIFNTEKEALDYYI